MKIKFSALFAILFILFGFNTTVFASDKPLSKTLYKYETGDERYGNSELIYSGDSFYIKLSGVSNTDIVEVDSTAFEVAAGTNPFVAEDIKIDNRYMLPLIYNGGKDRTITVKVYKGANEIKYSGYISKAVPSSDDDSSPSVTNGKVRFMVQNTIIPEFIMGETGTLDLEIKNIGKSTGKNISVDAKMPEGFEANEISTLRNYTSVGSKKSIHYKVKYNVSSDAKPGINPVEITYTYDVNGVTTHVKETINIRVKEVKIPAKINILDLKLSSDNIKAGDSFDIDFEIKNGGQYFCHDLVVYIENDLDGFMVKEGFNDKEIMLLMPFNAAEEVHLPVITNKDMKVGKHKLTIKIKYKDHYDAEHIETKDIIIDIKEPETNDGKVTFGTIESSKLKVIEDEEFTIKAQILNSTDEDVDNLYVSATFDEKIYPLSNPRIRIESLNKAGEELVEFSFKTNKEVSGNSNITIKLEKDGEIISQSTYPISIDGENQKQELTGSKPIVIIDKYTIEPKIVKAGEKFTLDIDFLNTHKYKTVDNIKIMIKAIEKEGQESQDVFAPVDGSTTFYIDSISPRSSKRISTVMSAIPDAKSKTYKLSVTIEYEYIEDKKIERTDISDELGITVRQKSGFMTSDLNIPPNVTVGSPIPIYLQINNTGKVTLSNFIVEIEGDFQTESKKQYIGNIDVGNTKWLDIEISPMNAGEQKGAVIFSYEEPTGELVSRRQEFTVNAEEFVPPTFDENEMGLNNNIEEKGLLGKNNNKNIKYIVIGAIIIVVIVVIIIVRKRKKIKAKKEMEAYDLDEYN